MSCRCSRWAIASDGAPLQHYCVCGADKIFVLPYFYGMVIYTSRAVSQWFVIVV